MNEDNPERLDLRSLDLVENNVRKIANLFPQCVVEGIDGLVIDFDILKQELSHNVVEGNKERYRLEWPGKKEAIVTANLPTNKTLRPVREDSVNFDNTENIYIEGDNLEVLKLLQESYLGKIKFIYIDPPYNTGKDFVYPDKFTKDANSELIESGQKDENKKRLTVNLETSGMYHSAWLTMLYPRLKLARNLLTEDGVIFISIDDHEVENLKKICIEIFGEANFIGQWNWFKSATPPNLSKKIKKNIEYILCFEKQRSLIKYHGVKKYSASDDPLTKSQNTIKNLTFKKGELNIKLTDQTIPKGEYGTKTYPNVLINDLIVKDGTNLNEVTFQNKFIWNQENLCSELKKGTKININSKSLVLSYKKAEYDAEVPPNLIDESVGVETTESAGRYLQTLMGGGKVFSYPKPISLIQYLLSFLDLKNDIVLDFFAGSSTTAECVLRMSKPNKFIMVQLPQVLSIDLVSEPSEKQIVNNSIEYLKKLGRPPFITELGKERIRRAAIKIKEEKVLNAKSGGLFANFKDDQDYGFRVFRLSDSNMVDVYYKPNDYTQNKLDLFADNVKPDRTAEDLLVQVMLDWGLALSLKIETKTISSKTVYFVAENSLVACFEKDIDESFAKEIAKEKPLRIVFKDSSFKDDTAKSNVRQLLKQLSPNTEMKVI